MSSRGGTWPSQVSSRGLWHPSWHPALHVQAGLSDSQAAFPHDNDSDGPQWHLGTGCLGQPGLPSLSRPGSVSEQTFQPCLCLSPEGSRGGPDKARRERTWWQTRLASAASGPGALRCDTSLPVGLSRGLTEVEREDLESLIRSLGSEGPL